MSRGRKFDKIRPKEKRDSERTKLEQEKKRKLEEAKKLIETDTSIQVQESPHSAKSKRKKQSAELRKLRAERAERRREKREKAPSKETREMESLKDVIQTIMDFIKSLSDSFKTAASPTSNAGSTNKPHEQASTTQSSSPSKNKENEKPYQKPTIQQSGSLFEFTPYNGQLPPLRKTVTSASKKQFVKTLLPHAVRLRREKGIPIACTLGMSGLECGYGTSALANNPKRNSWFGIKGGAYANVLESVLAYGSLLFKGRYQTALLGQKQWDDFEQYHGVKLKSPTESVLNNPYNYRQWLFQLAVNGGYNRKVNELPETMTAREFTQMGGDPRLLAIKYPDKGIHKKHKKWNKAILKDQKKRMKGKRTKPYDESITPKGKSNAEVYDLLLAGKMNPDNLYDKNLDPSRMNDQQVAYLVNMGQLNPKSVEKMRYLSLIESGQINLLQTYSQIVSGIIHKQNYDWFDHAYDHYNGDTSKIIAHYDRAVSVK